MSEVLSDQVELIENIPQKITEFLEYGINNGGWNTLLDIRVLENDVFILNFSWEETKGIIRRYNNEKSNLLEQEMESINNKLDKLGELSAEIIETLRKEIAEWPELENVKAKRDPGVILRALENVNFAQLIQDKKRVLDSLVRLLDEFILGYEEWKIFRENKLEQLNEVLENISKKKIKLGSKGKFASVRFPSNVEATREMDTMWGKITK